MEENERLLGEYQSMSRSQGREMDHVRVWESVRACVRVCVHVGGVCACVCEDREK